MKVQLIRIATSAILFGVSQLSVAGPYIGAATGSTDYAEIVGNVTSLELTAGYRLHDNLAIEISWLELGEDNIQATNESNINFGVDGTKMSLLFTFPITPDFELFTKFGIYYWDLESTSVTSAALIRSNSQEADADMIIGAGLAWYISENVGVRLLYQEIDIAGDNIENVSAGLTFSF